MGDPKTSIVAYFKEVSEYLGKSKEDPCKQAGYSLYDYFRDHFQSDLEYNGGNNILAAYFNLGQLPRDIKDLSAEVEEKLSKVESGAELNDEQREAVLKVFKHAISFIKGPPGTGKTKVIMHIVALAVSLGWTVAVVSANNEAVNNVVEKAEKAFDGGKGNKQDLLYQAAIKLAPLGNKKVREKAKPLDPKKSFKLYKGNGKQVTFSDFTAGKNGYPFITSTVHSLKKCFSDGYTAKYDLVIMDEASQTDIMVGAVALSSAKRMVIVGDEHQLSPIVSSRPDKNEEDQKTYSPPNNDRHYDCFRLDGYSFFSSCLDVLGDDSEISAGNITMLTKHYRCHPAIIGFCNEYVYGGLLEVETNSSSDEEVEFPIWFRWYDGDYRESLPRVLADGKLSKKGEVINFRQLAIFRDEELPILKRKLKEKPDLSVCILTPFHGQLGFLEKILKEELDDVHAPKWESLVDSSKDGENSEHGIDSSSVPVLTIHKSQGREYDIVYLLPVEDGVWEWPWSQGRRLINVAVSRAKSELRVIASAKLLSNDLQKKLKACVIESEGLHECDKSDGELFVSKLGTYVFKNQPQTKSFDGNDGRESGLIKTSTVSVFDRIPEFQGIGNSTREDVDKNKVVDLFSAPELAVKSSLLKLAESENLRVIFHVAFQDIVISGKKTLAAEAYEIYNQRVKNGNADIENKVGKATFEHMHFDAIYVNNKHGEVLMMVEIDGHFHRSGTQADNGGSSGHTVRELDVLKDWIVTNVCGGQLVHLGKDSTVLGYCESFNSSGAEALKLFGLRDKASLARTKERICTTGDNEPCKGPLLLRLPTDGSTSFEFEEFGASGGKSNQNPTVDKYLEWVIKAGKMKTKLTARFPSTSSVIKKLKSNESPKKHFNGNARAVLEKLESDSNVRRVDKDAFIRPFVREKGSKGGSRQTDLSWIPTHEGEGKGIYLMGKNPAETWIVYSERGEQLMENTIFNQD